MLSAALVVPMQQASADDVELNVKNECSDEAACSNSAAIAITNDGGTASAQSQSQSQQQSQ
jgi:hypothetical protein